MYSSELCQKVVQKFPDVTVPAVPDKYVRDPEPQIRVPAAKLVEVGRFLKDNPEMAFDMPLQMTAVDYIKENVFELVYHLYSSRKKQAIVVKSQIPRGEAQVDSLTPLWSGMDWQEREIYDLMGIRFKGHPNLTRIMLWEGYPGYPLRKDYVHVTDKYDSGLEVGTPGLDEKGLPAGYKAPAHG